ncbi:hypothetical protein Dimus_032405 [Dionaea muscipula]
MGSHCIVKTMINTCSITTSTSTSTSTSIVNDMGELQQVALKMMHEKLIKIMLDLNLFGVEKIFKLGFIPNDSIKLTQKAIIPLRILTVLSNTKEICQLTSWLKLNLK